MHYAIISKEADLLNIVLGSEKKSFSLLVLCIKIKFTIVCSLISLIKKICRVVSK